MKTLYEELIDILIYLVIIIGMVISYYGQRQDTLTQQLVSIETSDIVNTVQTQGVITREVYEDFLTRLNITNMIYDIKLEHKKLAIEPEYRLKTADEIINEQNGSYTGGNIYHYFPVSTEIPVVNDPSAGDLSMNTETNESVLSKAINTPALPGHVHTDECYGGHKHVSPYGTLDMTKIPIYMRLQRFSSFWNGSYMEGFDCRISFYCASCSQEMYAFSYRMDYSSVVILTEQISYGAYGQKNVAYNRVVITDDNNRSAALSQASSFYNYAVSMGATSASEYYSTSFIFPFAGYPYWDSAGNISYLSFTGCKYKTDSLQYERHINPNACFPVGKKTKVMLRVYSSYDSSTGNSSYNMIVTCSECNKVIQSSSVTLRGYSSSNVTSSSGSNWKDYLPNGSIVDVYRNGGMSTNMVGVYPNGNLNAFDNQNMEVYFAIQNIVNIIGSNNILGELNNYNTKIPVEYPLKGIPVRYGSYETFPVVWEPYRGCPYCGTYGNAYSCGKTSVISCEKVVKSITATHPIQAIYTGEALITTVTATYLDGSTKVVIANTTFNTNTAVTDENVTLRYSDAFGNTKTCTIKVTVVLRTKTCENGHTYNLKNDGTDPGCPYCKAWLRSLVVADPATGSITIYRGTTLKENGVLLMATYLDGRKELLDSGYVNNLDKNYIGSQTVTISYKGKNTSLNVTVKRNIVQCPVCKRYYELFPDDTDPGCPYCASRVPVFTGNVLKYYVETFSNEILEEIYDGSGAYYFNDEDYFSISITNQNETTGTKVLSVFFRTAPKVTLNVAQGGKIRNKAAYEGEK